LPGEFLFSKHSLPADLRAYQRVLEPTTSAGCRDTGFERFVEMKQFCRKLWWPLLILLVSFSNDQPARATTVVMVSDTDLIVSSRVIVMGTVISTTSAWDDTGSVVWTYVEVLTDRVLKGNVSQKRIVLKQLGGNVGESGLRVFGQAGFGLGERVLLYLNTGADGTLHAAHNFIGKFSVKQVPSDGREFVERSEGTSEVEILAGPHDAEVTNSAPLDEYIGKIQNILKRDAYRVAQFEAAQSLLPLLTMPPEYPRKREQGSELLPEFVLMAGGVRWMEADQGQAISYYVNPSGSPVAGGAAAEIGRAMTAWTNQSGAFIRLQQAGQTASCGISVNGVNSISFGDCLNQLDPPVGCTGVVALTAISYSQEPKVVAGVSFNRLIEADTVFNKGMDCFLATSSNLAEVACHELGHSIGLAHPPDSSAIMWAVAHGGGRDATLGADDKAGVLSIYPASSGTPGPGSGTPLSIATFGLVTGSVGRSYSAQLAATGGTQPYRWSLIGGVLPAGLTLSKSGSIDGIPQTANTYSFIVQVSDSSSPVTQDSRVLSIAIQSSGGSALFPVITSVRVKGSKKLWVTGENLSANSVLIVNGASLTPLSFDQSGALGELLVKGKLNLGPSGTNAVIAITAVGSSAPYFF
jgi:hypothetical protein